MVFREALPKTGVDLSLLRLVGPSTSRGISPSAPLGDNKRQTEPLLDTTFAELNAEVSPDGRWLAYQSDESGRRQIYVRPFPKVDGERWQISPGGGTRPVWARSGREVFCLDGSGFLTAVVVETTPTFSAGPSREQPTGARAEKIEHA